MKKPNRWLACVAFVTLATGCGRQRPPKPVLPATTCGDGVLQSGETCDDGNAFAADGCENDCSPSAGFTGVCGNSIREGAELCDDGNASAADGCESDCTVTGGTVRTCDNAIPAPTQGDCSVQKGTNGFLLLSGTVLTPGLVYRQGQVLVNASGAITCTGCDCASQEGADAATRVGCPEGVISPGLINSHDHITYQSAPYVPTTDERYEHRHDWREGNRSHTKINSGGTATRTQVTWAELRQLFSGTTSIVGVGGSKGLLRNLDAAPTGTSANQEGLGEGTKGLNADTFPLGDVAGQMLTTGCTYPGMGTLDPAKVIPADAAYLPHVSEGIDAQARNELLCLSGLDATGKSVFGERTAVVHGIGVMASDVARFAANKTGLVWSPRSNISLYGNTAPVPLYQRMGVRVALGTDWLISGSMNLLRELQCADYLNQSFYGAQVSDEGLWRMATSNAADVTQTAEKIGRLAVGKVADIAIFRSRTGQTYRAVVQAGPEDVLLTMRGGKALYGNSEIVAALNSTACDAVEVCGSAKAVCLSGELDSSWSTLKLENAKSYPLFACGGAPADEPACTPFRSASGIVNGSTAYSGVASTEDLDGDGVPNGADNCPGVFNPVRPVDNGQQANGDGDAQGDACDVCPLAADATSCVVVSDTDADTDGVADADDNCPVVSNSDQADLDQDGKGNACDFCPVANPGSAACPSTVYAVKKQPGLLDQRVAISGLVVTGVSASGFFAQVPLSHPQYAGADDSGIFVYKPSHGLTIGSAVDLPNAQVVDFYGQLQLSASTVNRAGTALVPAPVNAASTEVGTGGSRSRALEGVLVVVTNAVVTSLSPAPGPRDTVPTNEFEVDGVLRVNDALFLMSPPPAEEERFVSLTGVLQLRNGHSKLEPRSATDVVTGGAVLASLGPSSGTFARAGESGATFPSALTVTLSRPQAVSSFVTVTSSSSALVIPGGGVTVLAGQSAARVDVQGVVAAQDVTVTATLDGVSKSVKVTVLEATQPAVLVGLTPGTAAVSPGSSVVFTLTLDVPAPNPLTATVAVNPPSAGTFTSGVVLFEKNALTATAELVSSPAASGTAQTFAELQGVTLSSTLRFQPGASHVVISELAYQGASGTTAVAGDEFVELHNPTVADISIAGWRLQYKSATGTAYNTGYILPPGSTVQAKGYFLIAGTGYTGTVAPDASWGAALSGMAAAGGHVRLGPATLGTSPTDAAAVDTVGWGTANSPEGTVFPTSALPPLSGSLERKAKDVSTPASMDSGVDAAAGNGFDSNDNGQDFLNRALRQPQNRSSPTEG